MRDSAGKTKLETVKPAAVLHFGPVLPRNRDGNAILYRIMPVGPSRNRHVHATFTTSVDKGEHIWVVMGLLISKREQEKLKRRTKREIYVLTSTSRLT